jgi:hypothetical protein
VQDLLREQFVFVISRLSQRILNIAGREVELGESFPLVNVEEQLRVVLGKLIDQCVSLEALHKQGTFNMAMETDDYSSLDSDVRRYSKHLHRGQSPKRRAGLQRCEDLECKSWYVGFRSLVRVCPNGIAAVVTH